MYLDLLPDAFRTAGNLFVLFFVGETAAACGMREMALHFYERIKPLRDGCAMLGLSYLSWEGPWARLIGLRWPSLNSWSNVSSICAARQSAQALQPVASGKNSAPH